MLALKLGMSLVSSNKGGAGAWSPTDESSLIAWYQKGEGITLNGSDVSQWADSSTNSNDMVQATATEQPAYSNGVLTFNPSDKNNLETASHITIDDEFTIGFKANLLGTNVVFLGSNSGAKNEFFKYQSTTRLSIRINGVTKQFDLASGEFSDDYIVITRDSSDLITVYKNGTAMVDTRTLAGTVDIDAIGVRETDLNPFNGTTEEIQFYSSESAALRANVTERLASL
jgi:hypothetical protein|tara:strand:- start:29 stop:712 length:684 start_codon:yes stop_codon:yes gene_type:complete